MKAMILAAGVGSRLMPLTLKIPKPMLPIINKPALEHIVRLCKNHGIKEIKMNLHYLPEQIDHYFQNGEQFGIDISTFEDEIGFGKIPGKTICIGKERGHLKPPC